MNDSTPSKTKSIASTVLLVALALVYLLFQKKIDGLLGINKPDQEKAVATAGDDKTGPKTGPKTDDKIGAKTAANDAGSSKTPPPSTRQSVLKKEGRDYISDAGLVYTPGSKDGHRRAHVLQHAKNDTSKPVHGVFDDPDTVFALVDEAYVKIKRGDVKPGKTTRGATEYVVRMGRQVGYKGGKFGKKQPLSKIKLVLRKGNEVITAFPY